MNALIAHKSMIEDVFADAIRPMINAELSVVFFDVIAIRSLALSA